MGIRFRCPNGHKLNVKSFLAGKRGVCPYCKAKFLIPLESTELVSAAAKTAESNSENSAEPTNSSPPASPAATSSPAPSGTAQTVSGNSSDRGGTDTGPREHSSPKSNARPPGMPTQPSQDSPQGGAIDLSNSAPARDKRGDGGILAGASIRDSSNDPINEAPQAVWYVRPPSGGQFGPASGDIMRTWIAEGRVSADSLVWRQGWDEWQAAGAVFPVLNGNVGSSVELPATPQIVAAPSGRYPNRKGKRSQNTVVILLGAACLVLLVVLVFVVQRN